MSEDGAPAAVSMNKRNSVLATLALRAHAQADRASSQGTAPGADVAQSTASSVPAADWPTYNLDPAGWRFNLAETTLGPKNIGTFVEKWRFPAEGSKESIGVVYATPAVAAGE